MARVTFLHPDLGIGGAERLVIDAALALKNKGFEVNFVTTHHDPEHSFAETRDGTIPITVVGDWLPRHVFGKFFALCAYIRMIYAASCIYFMGLKPDVVFCDLVSVCIPILRLFVPHVIFYCHHPDQLLTKAGGRWKSLYRKPLNYLEEITTGQADRILVNSLYTKTVFMDTFKRLSVDPEVLYPSINTNFFDESPVIPLSEALNKELPENAILLLSINRYERKKNLSLAIQALEELKDYVFADIWEKIYLVMAGGYDNRVDENVEHYLELKALADELKLTEKIIFLRSPSDTVKVSLLAHCALLIYTPINEHFGIVPLEAMYCKKPVIAQDTGGPTESVVNGKTGYLVKSSARAIADRAAVLIRDESLRLAFGEAGHERFQKTFSFNAFATQLNKTIETLLIEGLVKDGNISTQNSINSINN